MKEKRIADIITIGKEDKKSSGESLSRNSSVS